MALAGQVKRGGRIWLGHSLLARSVRPYPDLASVWRMVARSAYVQLKLSPWLLAGSILGLAWLFVVPVVATLQGSILGLLAWIVMAGTFWPTLHRFRLWPLWAVALPAIALFYMAATIGSAWDHHRAAAAWFGRAAPIRRRKRERHAGECRNLVGQGPRRRELPGRRHRRAEAARACACVYAFARNADDIADSAELEAQDKIDRLDVMEAVLLGRSDRGAPSAMGLAPQPAETVSRRATPATCWWRSARTR